MSLKKIGVFGLVTFENIGDQILGDTCQYILSSLNKSNIIFEQIDIAPSLYSYFTQRKYFRFFLAGSFAFLGMIARRLSLNSSISYCLGFNKSKILYNKYYQNRLKKCDAIILSGGGFIKFRTQGLNYLLELLLPIASENHLPVMLNAQGIEGYDISDKRCSKLKQALIRNHVQIITTRDDYNTLHECYLDGKNDIEHALVGDPAFWIPECYAHALNYTKTDIVGVNVIRPDIFLDYGHHAPPGSVLQFYIDLIHQLDVAQVKWVLFSNGLEVDYKFGIELLKHLGIQDTSKLLPRPKTPIELINTIGSFKAIFGARMHACITAYSLDVPVTGIIWSDKLTYFSTLIGKRDNYFSEQEMDAKIVAGKIINSFSDKYDVDERNRLKNLTKFYLLKFIDSIL